MNAAFFNKIASMLNSKKLTINDTLHLFVAQVTAGLYVVIPAIHQHEVGKRVNIYVVSNQYMDTTFLKFKSEIFSSDNELQHWIEEQIHLINKAIKAVAEVNKYWFFNLLKYKLKKFKQFDKALEQTVLHYKEKKPFTFEAKKSKDITHLSVRKMAERKHTKWKGKTIRSNMRRMYQDEAVYDFELFKDYSYSKCHDMTKHSLIHDRQANNLALKKELKSSDFSLI